MDEEVTLRLSCSEAEFIDAFRDEGFLSPFIDEAAHLYVRHKADWFEHAEKLNKAGLRAYHRRDHCITGLSTHHPITLALRMIYRTLSAFQGAILLYRRGMAAEGDTLARNVYEAAFWLGFLQAEPDAAVRAFLNDERRSQRDRASYYLEQLQRGAYPTDPAATAELRKMIDRLKSEISKADEVSVRKVAERSGLYLYYDAYKHLSASSAHNSLNSLFRYLRPNGDGSYNGLIAGPDLEALDDSLPMLCIGLGIALAMFGTIVPVDTDEADLQDLLLDTDRMRRLQRASGGGLAANV